MSNYKKAGLGNLLADGVALGWRIPAYATKKTVGFAGDFGSRLTNNIVGDARKVKAGLDTIGKNKSNLIEDMADPTLSDHLNAVIGGFNKTRKGNMSGISDILENGPKALDGIDPRLTDAVIKRIENRKMKFTPEAIGAGLVGGAGLGYAANYKKEASIIPLKEKLRLLRSGKPKLRDMLIGGLVGAGAGEIVNKTAAFNFLSTSTGKLPLVSRVANKVKSWLPGFGPAKGSDAWKLKNGYSEGGKALKFENPEINAANKLKYHTQEHKAFRASSRPRLDRVEKAFGRAFNSKNPMGNIGRLLPIAGGELAAKYAPGVGKGLIGMATGAAGMYLKNKAADRIMMNGIKKWGPVAGMAAGGYALMRNNNNSQQKQAAINPKLIGQKAYNAMKRYMNNSVPGKIFNKVRARADAAVPMRGEDGRIITRYTPEINANGYPTGNQYPYTPITAPIGMVDATAAEIKDFGTKYGPTIAAATAAVKASTTAGKMMRAKYMAHQSAKREAKDIRAILGIGTGAVALTAGLNAYNNHNKYAGARETVLAKVLARTPNATNIEDAIAHWANKRNSVVSKLDDLGESNIFNAYAHNSSSRALAEAENNLSLLHKYNLTGEAGKELAPKPTSGITTKGLAVGAGIGALGMAAYARKTREPEPQYIYAQ